MAWKWVQKLKNDITGEYTYGAPAITITDEIIAAAGTSAYQIGGTKENGGFDEAYAVIADLAGQGATRLDLLRENYDYFFYGLVGGTAIEHKINISSNGSFTFSPYKWMGFYNSTRLSNVSGRFTDDTDKTKNVWYFGLLINDETEYAYLCAIHGTIRYPYYPAYFRTDSAYVDVYFFNDDPASHNLYPIIRGSVPGGGGGANPYDGGGTSTPGEQAATWDDSSDVISVPSAPGFTLILNKLIHAWAPSVSDLDSIGTYLWSNFDITDPTKTLSKVFQSPLESILTLHALPFAVSAGQAVRLTLAGFDTGVDLPPLTAQFIDVPCGSITIEPYWDNYLDYNPYTKITLCLPFAGQVTLDPDEVMGKTISVTYRVDCLTGSFVCFVYIDGDKVLGQYAGNCALSIPISAADYGRFNAAILGVAASAASAFGAVASGGAKAIGGALADVASSGVQEIQDAKVHVAHSGGLTGAPGFMGIQKPYLIIHRARQSVPEGYGGFKGYPLNVTKTLGECSGFTSVREIHLDGIPLTEPELAELRGILEGGIII